MDPPIPPPKRLTIWRPSQILQCCFDDTDVIIGDRALARGQNTCIIGPPGVGKSRLNLQIITAAIVGWNAIGFKTKPPGKWLVLQAENSTRRLKEDMRRLHAWVGDALWPRVDENLLIHVLQTDYDGFLTLENPENRKMIGEVIGDTKPAGVSWDCLQSFAVGDLNHDRDMFLTLSMISQLTKTGNPERTPLVLHHASAGRVAAARAVGMDRGTFSRNSKAQLGWTRSQWNLAPGGEDDAVIVSCGKLSDGKEFSPFAIRLNPDTMIYEVDLDFDLTGWQADMSRKSPPAITSEQVAAIANGGKSRKELTEEIMAAVSCGKTAAYNAILRAEKRKAIHYATSLEKFIACLPR